MKKDENQDRREVDIVQKKEFIDFFEKLVCKYTLMRVVKAFAARIGYKHVWHSLFYFNEKSHLVSWTSCLQGFLVGLLVCFSGMMGCGSSSPSSVSASPALLSAQGNVVSITSAYELKQWDSQGNFLSSIQQNLPHYQKAQILPDGQHILLYTQTDITLVSAEEKEAPFSIPFISIGTDEEPLAAVWLEPFHLILLTKQGQVQEWKQGMLFRQTTLQARPELFPLDQAQFSVDGKQVATLQKEDTSARIWNTISGEPILFLGDTSLINPIENIAFSPDGQKLVTVDTQGNIVRWDLPDPTTLPTSATPTKLEVGIFDQMPVSSLAISSDASLIAMAGTQRTIVVWKQFPPARSSFFHPPMYGLWRRLVGHQAEVSFLTFSSLSHQLLSSSLDQTLKLWDLQEDQVSPVFDFVNDAQFSSDQQHFFVSRPGSISIFPINGLDQPFANLTPIISIVHWNPHLSYDVGRLAPSGQMLVAQGETGADIWDLQNIEKPKRIGRLLINVSTPITRAPVFFSPDSRFLFSSWQDGSQPNCSSLVVWDMKTLPPVPLGLDPRGYPSPAVAFSVPCLLKSTINSISYSKEGNVLYAFSSASKEVKVVSFSATDGLQVLSTITSPDFTQLPGRVSSFIPTPGSFEWMAQASDKELVFLSSDNIFQVWNIENKKMPTFKTAWLFNQAVSGSMGSGLQLDPINQNLLFADKTNRIKLLDPITYQIKSSIIHPLFVAANVARVLGRASLSPSGKQGFLFFGNPTSLLVWQVPFVREMLTLPVP